MNPRFFLPALLAASLANAQPAAPDAAPAKADKAATQTEMQAWIEATDAQWQAAFKRDVTDVREAETRKVMLQYITLLEGAIDKASKASDLDGAVALRNEQKRFGDTQLFPEQDEAGDPAAVKQARATIHAQLAQLEKNRAVRARALHAKYDQVLAQAQAQLTQAKRLDDALLVKAKREEVSAAWLARAPATIGQPKPPSQVAPLGSAKGSNEQFKVFPYVQELGTVKFAPHDERVPDELQVVVNGQQFQIAGSKKGSERHILDRTTGHHGKVVLISAKAPQSGTLLAKVRYEAPHARYGIVLELANGTIKNEAILVDADVAYDWSLQNKGSNVVFTVSKQGKPIASMEMPAGEIEGFGFTATVRGPQDEADLTVNLGPTQR
jgi:hypothetical protein